VARALVRATFGDRYDIVFARKGQGGGKGDSEDGRIASGSRAVRRAQRIALVGGTRLCLVGCRFWFWDTRSLIYFVFPRGKKAMWAARNSCAPQLRPYDIVFLAKHMIKAIVPKLRHRTGTGLVLSQLLHLAGVECISWNPERATCAKSRSCWRPGTRHSGSAGTQPSRERMPPRRPVQSRVELRFIAVKHSHRLCIAPGRSFCVYSQHESCQGFDRARSGRAATSFSRFQQVEIRDLKTATPAAIFQHGGEARDCVAISSVLLIDSDGV